MEITGPFDRSIPNRAFAAFLSLLLGFPTGWGLLSYWTRDHGADNPDWIVRVFVNACMDLVGVLFAVSALGLVWAIFLPNWVEQLLSSVTQNLVKSLAILLCIVLLMLGVAYLTIYRR